MLHLKTSDNTESKLFSLCALNNFQPGESSAFQQDEISLAHRNLLGIANVPLNELVSQNKNLLVFPQSIDKSYGRIDGLPIFEMYGCADNLEELKIRTGNLMGFLGTGGTQAQITSRFADGENDNFLHYMLSKVFSINLFKLDFNASSGRFFDILIFLFPYFLKKALTQGIFKTYRTFDRNDSNVKGAVDVSRHIKSNIPFSGKISYRERRQAFDNPLTELVRHTIEFIKAKPLGTSVLSSDLQTKSAVNQIIEVTGSYNLHERSRIIFQNAKPVRHPYFCEWTPLQKICLAILSHKNNSYHQDKSKVYGLLFDGAWLWEEYLATILTPLGFSHPRNKERSGGIRMFENEKDELDIDRNFRRIYPDFYKKGEMILDAKYKNLQNGVCREDLYQVVSYMHTTKIPKGGFIFPAGSGTNFNSLNYKLAGYGGTLSVIGMKIPQGGMQIEYFCVQMESEEEKLKNRLL